MRRLALMLPWSFAAFLLALLAMTTAAQGAQPHQAAPTPFGYTGPAFGQSAQSNLQTTGFKPVALRLQAQPVVTDTTNITGSVPLPVIGAPAGLVNPDAAEEATATATATVTATATPTVTVSAPEEVPEEAPEATDEEVGDDVEAEATAQVTESIPALVPTPTPSVPITATTPGEQVTGPTAAGPDIGSDEDYAETLAGTILANRTDATVKFFLEGQTYVLDARRSTSVGLARSTSVLNLYNCDANVPEGQGACFWDPYVLNRNGFYEIVQGADTGRAAMLLLQPAGTPPGNQIWVHNRTGMPEQIVYRNETYDVPPATVQELMVEADALPTVFVRTCIEANGERACEWAPTVVEPGVYYALEEVILSSAVPNSSIAEVQLLPVLAEGGIPVTEESAPPEILCRLQVPVVNVRSGPGLEYQIVAKIRGTEDETATVLVVGRDPTAQWLAVDERVADGGWVTGSSDFVVCDGELENLSVAEVTDGRLAPTPTPEAVAQAPAEVAPAADDGVTPEGDGEAESAEEEAPAGVEVPQDLGVIVVNNGFDHDIRFTLDQRFRVEPGPSEYDLAPGGSVSIVVFPGTIAFSASSPWNGLSGNAEFVLEPDQSRTLWLVFFPDPDGSGEWEMGF